ITHTTGCNRKSISLLYFDQWSNYPQVAGHRRTTHQASRTRDLCHTMAVDQGGGPMDEGVDTVRGRTLPGNPGGLLVLQVVQVPTLSAVDDPVLLVAGHHRLGADLLAVPGVDELYAG